ncbi:MAG: DUF45 domain-containing protein [Thermomicrobiales bacterium]|jgi:predicted metal-dependent hydrolase|nr:MAG: DUF45 domain-containing protein [Thermomicrobiales bacterium]
MRRTSLDLQLELPLGAGTGDQMALPLDDKPLPYRLRRNDGSAIRVTVEAGVMSVIAPRHVRLPAIETALRERAPSVLPQAGHLPELPREWCDGVRFPFLGQDVTLKLGSSGESRLCGAILELALPPNASQIQIRDALHGWLQAQARTTLKELVDALEPARAWSLSFSRNTLAASDADGRLRLNWRLVLLSRESIVRLLNQIPRCAADNNAQIDLLADRDNEPAPARTTRTAVSRTAGRR